MKSGRSTVSDGWSYLLTPPLGQDITQGQSFKWSLTVLNSEFSFYTSCLTKAEEISLPYYLPIAGGKIIGFIPFQRVLVLCEMQSVFSRIWTRVAVSSDGRLRRMAKEDNSNPRSKRYMMIMMMIYKMCPWCIGYRRRNWTRRYEFKSWTRLIALHIALIPLGKVWIQLFSLQLWVNSRTD